MLLTLVSVLVLLVIGFFALWIFATGRVSTAEEQELTLGGRIIVLGVALVSFVAAYSLYQKPESAAGPAAVMSSKSPDSRGAEAVLPTAMDTAATPATDATPEAMEESIEDEEPEEVELADAASKPEPESQPEPAAVAPAATPASEPPAAEVVSKVSGISQSAMQREADAAKPQAQREAPVVVTRRAAEPVVMTEPPKARRRVQPPVARAPRISSAARRSEASGPVLLHVHNSLGRRQQREQLTLSIEGLPVADIEVDSSQPSVAIAVPLPRPGLLHYRLEGVSEQGGAMQLVGEGCISVRDGARFVVRRREGSRKVFLEAASG